MGFGVPSLLQNYQNENLLPDRKPKPNPAKKNNINIIIIAIIVTGNEKKKTGLWEAPAPAEGTLPLAQD